MNSSLETAVLRILNIEFKHQIGGSDPSIPYIISPRHTLLLNEVPTLRWNKVPDANSYVVRIMKGSEIHWQEEVSGTEVVYPGVPPLEPEVDYLLTVETDNGKSSLDGGEAQLGFKLLNEEATQAVREAAVKIASDLADEAKVMILAQRYSYFNLRVDAIKILEALVERGSQTAAVYQLLGKVYAASGLNLLAEELYVKAIALASDSQDLEVLMEAQAELAGVKIMFGKENEQEQLSNQAQAVVTPLRKDDCCLQDPDCSHTCTETNPNIIINIS